MFSQFFDGMLLLMMIMMILFYPKNVALFAGKYMG